MGGGRRVPRPEEPVDPDAGPLQALAWELRQLRERAGKPTYEVLARRSGYSRATLAKAASGRERPTEEVVLAYAVSCGADRQVWLSRYHRLTRELAAAGAAGRTPARYRDRSQRPAPSPSIAPVLEDLADAV